MMYLPGLIVALGAMWFALSGETSPLFLFLAAVSVLVTLWLCARLRIIGRDASPYHRVIQVLIYFSWLAIEIVKANISVIVRVLGPSHAINPDVVRIRTNVQSDLGRALFANSITLTPGTVTLDTDGDILVVHTLVRENGRAENFIGMDRGSTRAVDPPLPPLPQTSLPKPKG
jgi:multicomponent Na+:H+ antiporter subunit E